MNKGNALIIFLAVLISAIVGGFCWTYSINTVLGFFGRPKTVKFWQGTLIGFIPYFGQVSIPVSVVIWILDLII